MLKSENFEYLLDTRLKKVYDKTWKEIPSRLDSLFTTRSSDKAVEYDYTLGDIGLPEAFDGQVKYQDISGQYRQSYSHEELVTGIRIQRKLVDDDQYDVIDKLPSQLSRSMKLQREEDGASVFANAFNVAYAGSDAVALCSNSHPYVGTSDTQDNSGAYELTIAYLKTVRLVMQKTKTDKGNLAGVMPSMLLVPIDLADTAAEITKSELVPYSDNANQTNQTINVNLGRYSVMDWIYLQDTNNWFMIDPLLMKMFLIWYNRKGVEFNRDNDMDTYVRKYSTYMRYSKGFSGWNWLYGNNVA